jgi:hypothetical protein
MMAVMRFLFALLVGFIAGVAGTLYLVSSGTGDLVIRRTEVVQEVERRLHDVESQRDQLSRQLEDVLARAGRMETAFNDMEKRFRDLQQDLDRRAPETH